MKLLSIILLVVTSVPLQPIKSKVIKSPCCLCECRSSDQTKCSSVCIMLQHSKKTVEEDVINVCTKTCTMDKVKQVPKDWEKEFKDLK